MDPTLWNNIFAENSKPRTKPLGADQRLLILQKLQGKLDLGLLFEIFAREVEKQIDVSRLVWDLDETSTLIRRGQLPNTAKVLSCVSVKTNSASFNTLRPIRWTKTKSTCFIPIIVSLPGR